MWKSTSLCVALAAVIAPFLLDLATRVGYESADPSRSAVLVTGASTGIGRHAAEWMASKGFTVYAGVRKDSDAAKILQAGIDNLFPLKLDVTADDSVAAAVEFVSADLKKRGDLGLAGLVNNAGISIARSVEFADIDEWKGMYDVNVFGVVRCVQAFLPLLRQSKGRIVSVSSLAGLTWAPFWGPYASSKWALEAVSHSLRQELYPHGVSVSVVNPAFVKSKIYSKASLAFGPEEQKLYGAYFAKPGPIKEACLRVLASREMMDACYAKADEPDVTSQAIDDALTARYPKTRYLVASFDGVPAKAIAFLQWLLPSRILDKIIMLSHGIS